MNLEGQHKVGEVGGMICVAKEEVNLDTERRVCFVPVLPLSAHTINQNANSHPLFFRRNMHENLNINEMRDLLEENNLSREGKKHELLFRIGQNVEGVIEELPNLSQAFLDWIQPNEEFSDVPPIELSQQIWYHVLSILSSSEYNNSDWLELPAGIVLPVPIPNTLERLMQSADLGRQIASLQRLDPDNVNHEQEIEVAISELFNQIELEPYSISGVTSSTAIIAQGLSLDTGHGSGGKIKFNGYRNLGEATEIDEDLLSEISTILGVSVDNISATLGSLQSIQLSADIGLRNVPSNVLNMNIGRHVVLGQWLAWRCESVVSNQPVENLWNDLRRLLMNMVHMRLLDHRLDVNFEDCSNNFLEWD